MLHHDSTMTVEEGTKKAKEYFASLLDERLNSVSPQVEAGLRAIEEEGKALIDYGVPFTGESRAIDFGFDDKKFPVMNMRFKDGGNKALRLRQTAVTDIANRLSLPGDWMRQSLIGGQEWRKQLAVDVLNKTITNTPGSQVLVRAVHDEARAVLTPGYVPWEGWQVALAFVEAARGAGAVLTEATATDSYIYVNGVLPRVYEVELPNHGLEYLSIGIQYRTSDFGRGSQQVKGLVERIWCTNRAISKQELRNVHSGGNTSGFDAFALAETIAKDTYEARTRMHALTVRDTVKAVLDPKRVESHLLSISSSAGQRVTESFVTQLTKKGMLADEVARIKDILMESDNRLVPGGPMTRYKVAQAIGALSHDDEVGRDRKHFLEELSGSLIYNTEVEAAAA